MRRKHAKNRHNHKHFRALRSIESLENRQLMAADLGAVLGPVDFDISESEAAQIDSSSSNVGSDVRTNVSSSATNFVATAYTLNGYLYIVGTDEADGRDNVFVREVGSQSIEVTAQKWNDSHQLLGSNTTSFLRHTIPKGIRFYGYAGNDTFSNNTDLPSFASGGEGDDVLLGGSVYDSLYGDNGDDLVSGRDGGDFLNGGSGDDTVSGGYGRDIMFGGYGADNMYVVSATTICAAAPGRTLWMEATATIPCMEKVTPIG